MRNRGAAGMQSEHCEQESEHVVWRAGETQGRYVSD